MKELAGDETWAKRPPEGKRKAAEGAAANLGAARTEKRRLRDFFPRVGRKQKKRKKMKG